MMYNNVIERICERVFECIKVICVMYSGRFKFENIIWWFGIVLMMCMICGLLFSVEYLSLFIWVLYECGCKNIVVFNFYVC